MVQTHPLFDAILNGDAKAALATTEQALAAGSSPLSLVTDCMIPAMEEVGRRFEQGEYFVPELMIAGRAMKAALGPIRPLLERSGTEPAGRVVIGTVKGDLHDIGKNLVASMLEGAGFAVNDLGTDVSPQAFVEAIRRTGADIVCLSALLTVTMGAMRTTIDAIRQAGLRDSVKVLIGGAPVTAQFAAEIGADACGENAIVAVSVVRSLLGAGSRA